jgi:hypothetical protein
MDGDVHLDEVERAIGHDLPRGDVETIAGLLIAELGALPAEGDTVTVDLPVDPADLVDDSRCGVGSRSTCCASSAMSRPRCACAWSRWRDGGRPMNDPLIVTLATIALIALSAFS